MHPESNKLGTREFLACFHDVGGERDRHDEEKNDVAFQLRLPLQFVRGKRHTAGQCRSASKESHRVSHFDHAVPSPLQAERFEDSIRETVRGRQVEHICREHQEAPEHQHVHDSSHRVGQDFLLTQPAGQDLLESEPPRIKTVLRSAPEHQSGRFLDLEHEESGRRPKQHDKQHPTGHPYVRVSQGVHEIGHDGHRGRGPYFQRCGYGPSMHRHSPQRRETA